MELPLKLSRDLFVLPSSTPAAGGRCLPVHAFVLRGSHPVLVDTGVEREAGAFLEALDTVLDVRAIRTVLLTHEDADHAGALHELMRRAPEARLVTTGTGYGKLTAQTTFAPDRVDLVRPGTVLELGDRTITVLRPPMYDSPATLAFHDEGSRALFASDAFGAFLPCVPELCESLDLETVGAGMSEFCRANSPWLALTDRRIYRRELHALSALDLDWVLPSHLPPISRGAFEPLFARAARFVEEGEIALPERIAAASSHAGVSP